MVVIDTNIIIDHLRQLQKEKDSLLAQLAHERSKEILAISIISIQELYQGRSVKDEKKEKDLLATIAPLQILPYTYEIAQLGGEIARDLDHTIELADAAIAATAILNNSSLYTVNKKDFKDIKDLQLLL